MSEKKASKQSKRGRPKKHPYKSLFQRLGTETKLERAEDAYFSYLAGDHIAKSACRKHGMPLYWGLEIAGQILAKEKEDNVTIPADILAKHGATIAVLTARMLKHRKELKSPPLQRRVQRAALDISRYYEDHGALALKFAAEEITGEKLSSRNISVNDSLSALLHHYSEKRVSPDNIRKTLRRGRGGLKKAFRVQNPEGFSKRKSLMERKEF